MSGKVLLPNGEYTGSPRLGFVKHEQNALRRDKVVFSPHFRVFIGLAVDEVQKIVDTLRKHPSVLVATKGGYTSSRP